MIGVAHFFETIRLWGNGIPHEWDRQGIFCDIFCDSGRNFL